MVVQSVLEYERAAEVLHPNPETVPQKITAVAGVVDDKKIRAAAGLMMMTIVSGGGTGGDDTPPPGLHGDGFPSTLLENFTHPG